MILRRRRLTPLKGFKSQKERLERATGGACARRGGAVSNPRRNVWNPGGEGAGEGAHGLFQIPEGTFGTLPVMVVMVIFLPRFKSQKERLERACWTGRRARRGVSNPRRNVWNPGETPTGVTGVSQVSNPRRNVWNYQPVFVGRYTNNYVSNPRRNVWNTSGRSRSAARIRVSNPRRNVWNQQELGLLH